MVDKDLFLYDLAVVAILKNEGPYLKEWLDYHLLAGVDHFYLYDNDSSDNQAEVAAPYVEAGLVDYFPLPGKCKQGVAYRTAVSKFKFQSRYMAFIDCDEFIFPKLTGGGGDIVKVVDEILSRDPNAGGLAICWRFFGSNGQEKADYSRGVLERFTRRVPDNWTCPGMGNDHIKTLANPRKIDRCNHPHYPIYFEGLYNVNENGGIVAKHLNKPVTVKKIALNHYFTKSREEYLKKRARGRADIDKMRPVSQFDLYDRNDEFDDGILKYREARAKVYQPPDNSHVAERLLSTLERNLSRQTNDIETLLTCRAVAAYLKEKTYEEAALKATLQALANAPSVADKELFKQELPKLLELPYPVVEELRKL